MTFAWVSLRQSARDLLLASPAIMFVATVAPASGLARQHCDPGEAQQLLERSPRPRERIEAILANCRREGSADWRIPLLEARLAREAGDLTRAVAILEAAERQTPDQANIRGELAYSLILRGANRLNGGDAGAAERDFDRAATLDPDSELAAVSLANLLEQRGETRRARTRYERALAIEPRSRGALLGLARIARAEQRWRDAEAIYADLLDRDPRDHEARAGRAFVAIGEYRIPQASAAFAALVAEAPDNADFRTGLAQARSISRYQLEVRAGFARTDAGEAASGKVDFLANLDARNGIALSYAHYTEELPVAQTFVTTPLPSHGLRGAFITAAPGRYTLGLSYDLRLRDDLPAEHWFGVDGSLHVGPRIQLSAGVRQSTGADIWDNRYVRTGIIVDPAPGWRAAANLYFEHYEIAAKRDVTTVAGDIYRFLPGGGLVSAGASYNPRLDNLNLHGSAVIPIGTGALLLSAERATINGTVLATIGWRLRWW